MNVNNSESAYFKQYGKSFQEKIFQSLLTDKTWSIQMVEVMTPTYFELRYLRFLSEKYFSYFTQYKDFPTLGLLVSIARDDLIEGSDIVLREQVVEFLHRIKSNPNPGDLKYVKEKTLDFCKKQAMKDALEKAVELVAANDFEPVVDLMKTAICVGMSHSIGHDFFDDIEKRFISNQRIACPTGIIHIDKKDVLNGGLARGEIGVITANTGVGKSHFLVHLGSEALRLGKNVVHYTFELSETAVGIRYDSNLCSIPSSDVREKKEEVLKTYENKDLGRLIIKEYPTGTATINTIKNHLEKLELKSFIPSLIIIDYADIMRSTHRYDTMRHELKFIYEEIRNLAMDMNVPVWTASQANRDSANSDIVGLENMSEAYGKAMVADVVLSVSRKAVEKSSGLGRLFIAKNRAGRDGILYPIKIDTSMSKIEVLDESDGCTTLSEALAADSKNMKALLKNKWQELTVDQN
jgi:replicative DNA helicase